MHGRALMLGGGSRQNVPLHSCRCIFVQNYWVFWQCIRELHADDAAVDEFLAPMGVETTRESSRISAPNVDEMGWPVLL
jgi:hypothetical protein